MMLTVKTIFDVAAITVLFFCNDASAQDFGPLVGESFLSPPASVRFGSSIAHFGDFLAIGAETEAVDGERSSEVVLVYTKDDNGGWQFHEMLSPSPPIYFFGKLLAMRDGMLLIAGSYTIAYYQYSVQDSWTLAQMLPAPTITLLGGRFSVDSFALVENRLAVGCGDLSKYGRSQGAAFLYELSQATGRFEYTQELIASDFREMAFFGQSIAMLGDTLLIGAPFDNMEGHKVGAVYVFLYEDGAFVEKHKLVSNLPTEVFFGMQLAVSDRFIAIGSTKSIHTYSFAEPLDLLQTLTNVQDISNPYVGTPFLVTENVLVASNNDQWCSNCTAQLYTYDEVSAEWKVSFNLRTSVTSEYSREARSVLISGSFTRLEDGGDDGNGTVQLFVIGGRIVRMLEMPQLLPLIPAPPTTQSPTSSPSEDSRISVLQRHYSRLNPEQGNPGDYFGAAVDMDDTTLAIGTYHRSVEGVAAAGAVMVYGKNSQGEWIFQQELTEPFPGTYHLLGVSVAVYEDTLVAGGCRDGRSWHNPNIVHVFVRSGGIWSFSQSLEVSNLHEFQSFGGILAIFGNDIAVGSSNAAYIFSRTAGGMYGLEEKLTPDVQSFDFGMTLALHAALLVVCGAFDGSCYLYTKEAGYYEQAGRIRSDRPNLFAFRNAVDVNDELICTFVNQDVGDPIVFVYSAIAPFPLLHTFEVQDRAWFWSRTVVDIALSGSIIVVRVFNGHFDEDNVVRGMVYRYHELYDSWSLVSRLFPELDNCCKSLHFDHWPETTTSLAVSSTEVALGFRYGSIEDHSHTGAVYLFSLSMPIIELPSEFPSMGLTVISSVPTVNPTDVPSAYPTAKSSSPPFDSPSDKPSSLLSDSPSNNPTDLASTIPSDKPSLAASVSPSLTTSDTPSMVASLEPSTDHSTSPSDRPSATIFASDARTIGTGSIRVLLLCATFLNL